MLLTEYNDYILLRLLMKDTASHILRSSIKTALFMLYGSRDLPELGAQVPVRKRKLIPFESEA